MPIYDGVVTVADDDIPVIVELDETHVRLSASGTEIGQWRTEDCEIAHVADSTYTISAEDETLSFVPNQPSLFAAALNGGSVVEPGSVVDQEPEPDSEPESVDQPAPAPDDGVREAPPPKPLTMGLFYALCLVTAGLAVWSLISMIL